MNENCSDYVDQIVYLLDNELDETEIATVRAHLEGCSPCADSYSRQLVIKTIVARSCIEQAPSGLRDRILMAMRQVQGEV